MGDKRIAVIEERLRNMDKAIELQAAEYNRRLDELNHANEQAAAKDRSYVTVDVHERDLTANRAAAANLAATNASKADTLASALTEARTEADRRFARIESFQAKILGALAVVTFVVPTIVYLLAR